MAAMRWLTAEFAARVEGDHRSESLRLTRRARLSARELVWVHWHLRRNSFQEIEAKLDQIITMALGRDEVAHRRSTGASILRFHSLALPEDRLRTSHHRSRREREWLNAVWDRYGYRFGAVRVGRPAERRCARSRLAGQGPCAAASYARIRRSSAYVGHVAPVELDAPAERRSTLEGLCRAAIRNSIVHSVYILDFMEVGKPTAPQQKKAQESRRWLRSRRHRRHVHNRRNLQRLCGAVASMLGIAALALQLVHWSEPLAESIRTPMATVSPGSMNIRRNSKGLAGARPIQHDLAALATAHDLEAIEELARPAGGG